MIYVRGNPRDFDGWSTYGVRGWSYHEVLPYFKKSEAYHGPPSPYHGDNGPLSVIDCRHPTPILHAFVEAAAALGGTPEYNDFNGAQQDAGAGFYQSTRTPAGVRVTAASAFVKPVMRRTNLRVMSHVRVTRLVIDNALRLWRRVLRA